ncbi:MAG: LysR family transcriptional regulator [Pseudomonadota bacterium]
MEWQGVTFDWNQARAFLVTAEEGSLSAAARALGLTQPTLGRQVAGLEAELGVSLFERVGTSLTLTQTGLELLDHFRLMGDAANRISLAASGQSQTIEGHVTISATNLMATQILPPILRTIRELAPAIELDIVTTNELSDLRRREADIALRHARPEHPELIAKLIYETTAHPYAASSFLEAHGRPTEPADLADAHFVGFDHPERLLPTLNAMGLPVTRQNFNINTASGTVTLELIRHGLGIGFLPREIAENILGVEQVLASVLPPIPVQTWLVAHRELHTSRRIRIVFDALAKGFQMLKEAKASSDQAM